MFDYNLENNNENKEIENEVNKVRNESDTKSDVVEK